MNPFHALQNLFLYYISNRNITAFAKLTPPHLTYTTINIVLHIIYLFLFSQVHCVFNLKCVLCEHIIAHIVTFQQRFAIQSQTVQKVYYI